MNKLIKELSSQAWHYADSNSRDGDGTHGGLYRDKFAQLIIRERVSQLNIPDVPGPVSAGLNLGKVAIKEHFGVE